MPSLNDDLSELSRAIVHGKALSSLINTSYRNYSAAVSIEVYRNNYRGNLHDALAGVYPVLEKLVGKDFFRLITRNYIQGQPSLSGNLHQYGKQMTDFLTTFEPAQKLVYLADVAALEWACHCAYFADNAPSLDLSKLAQIPEAHYPDLILRPHPACHLVCSHYPITTIWHAHQPGAPCDFQIDLNSGSGNVLVYRHNDVVLVNQLTDADSTWLQGILAGTPLGSVTDATLDCFPDFDLQAVLLNSVAQGVFSDFSLSTPS